VLLGAVFLLGALLPSSGPGAGPTRSGGPTLSVVLRWVQVAFAIAATAAAFDLSVPRDPEADRTWGVGAQAVGVFAVLATIGVSVGQHAAPDVAWRTIGAALGPVGAGLLILLSLVTAERAADTAGGPTSGAHAPWFLAGGALLIVDRILPPEWTLDAILGPAAPLVVLALVAATVYGGVLLLGALGGLARDEAGVRDLGTVHDR